VAREGGVLRVFNLEMDRPGMRLYERRVARGPAGETDAPEEREQARWTVASSPFTLSLVFLARKAQSRFCQVARRELAGELLEAAAVELHASCDRGSLRKLHARAATGRRNLASPPAG